MDSLEIREITDLSKARKNPYLDNIKKYGFSVTVRYSPDDVAKIIQDTCERDVDLLQLDPEEIKALERYREANRQ
jgi:hypothetical protein